MSSGRARPMRPHRHSPGSWFPLARCYSVAAALRVAIRALEAANRGHFGIGEPRSLLAAPAELCGFGERRIPAASYPPDPPAVNDPDEADEPSWIQLPSSKSTPGKFGSRVGSAPACGPVTPTFDAAPPLGAGVSRFKPPELPAREPAVVPANPPVAALDAPPRELLPPAGLGGRCPPSSPSTAPPQPTTDKATKNPIKTLLLFIRAPRSLLCRFVRKWVSLLAPSH